MHTLKPVNMTGKEMSRAAAAHEAGEYIGIDRQIYDFVREKFAQECVNITPIYEAILDNEIYIETDVTLTHAYIVGPFVMVDVLYKGTENVSPKVYERVDIDCLHKQYLSDSIESSL